MEAFDKDLAAIVETGKLSGSQVRGITELAMEHIKNDAHIASSLFRTHKRAKAGNKLYALYVLDAIARECKSQARKQARADRQGSNSPMPGAPADGTPAGFLSKTEMFLERMVDESKMNGAPGHLDKVKKLITIWQQAGTFSAPLLTRCLARLSGAQSTTPPGSPPPNAYKLPTTGSGAMRASGSSDSIVATPQMPIDAQNALAALLASAQPAASAQPPVASTSSSNLLGNLALLQSLASQTAAPPAHPPIAAVDSGYRREMPRPSPPRRRSASPPPRANAILQGDPNNPFQARHWIRQGAQFGQQLPTLDQIHAWCLAGGLAELGIPREAVAAAGSATPGPLNGSGQTNEPSEAPPPRRGKMVQTAEGRWVFSSTAT